MRWGMIDSYIERDEERKEMETRWIEIVGKIKKKLRKKKDRK